MHGVRRVMTDPLIHRAKFGVYCFCFLCSVFCFLRAGSQVGPVPEVMMYGVTANQNSVLCHVHGFSPYFYCPAPPYFKESMVRSRVARLSVPSLPWFPCLSCLPPEGMMGFQGTIPFRQRGDGALRLDTASHCHHVWQCGRM